MRIGEVAQRAQGATSLLGDVDDGEPAGDGPRSSVVRRG